MYTTLDCIALRTVRHSDRHSILSAYTRQRGRMSFLIPAGNGREATRRRAMLMPG
ncbi:MAG: recombination protein O N-terminal domain-containing protein, partial [Muribaculaceae bacterium]|nr:recombination protein O N-terminal domain-containing protein [Muribaculaceae bacterium]